jgi:hypothetical protein
MSFTARGAAMPHPSLICTTRALYPSAASLALAWGIPANRAIETVTEPSWFLVTAKAGVVPAVPTTTATAVPAASSPSPVPASI